MTLLNSARLIARRLGLEVQRFNTLTIPSLRTTALLRQHAVDLVVDVGANDGGYGRELRSTGYDGRILSFEPISAAHSALMASSANDPRWSIAERMALGVREETATLNIAGNSKSSSLLGMLPAHEKAAPGSAYVGQETCRVARLDALAMHELTAAQRIFLKIDTQGYEEPVYEGAAGLIQRVIGIQCEMSLTPLYEGQPLFSDLLSRFEADGFSLWNVLPGFVDRKSGRMLQVDGVFFRRGDE